MMEIDQREDGGEVAEMWDQHAEQRENAGEPEKPAEKKTRVEQDDDAMPGLGDEAVPRGARPSRRERWNRIACMWRPDWQPEAEDGDGCDGDVRPAGTGDVATSDAWTRKFIADPDGDLRPIYVTSSPVLVTAMPSDDVIRYLGDPMELLQSRFSKLSSSLIHPAKGNIDTMFSGRRGIWIAAFLISAGADAVAAAGMSDLNSPMTTTHGPEDAIAYVELAAAAREHSDDVRDWYARFHDSLGRDRSERLKRSPAAERSADQRDQDALEVAQAEVIDLVEWVKAALDEGGCGSLLVGARRDAKPATEQTATAGRPEAELAELLGIARVDARKDARVVEHLVRSEPLITLAEILREVDTNPKFAENRRHERGQIIQRMVEIFLDAHGKCITGGALAVCLQRADVAACGPAHWQSLKGPGLLAAMTTEHNEVIVDLTRGVAVTGVVLRDDALAEFVADTQEDAIERRLQAQAFWERNPVLWDIAQEAYAREFPLVVLEEPRPAPPGDLGAMTDGQEGAD
jgi:hypothetical protein